MIKYPAWDYKAVKLGCTLKCGGEMLWILLKSIESISLQSFHMSRFVGSQYQCQVLCISGSRKQSQAGVLTIELSLRVTEDY